MTSTMTPLDTPRETATDTIRPFQFHASDEDLADLRQRIKATRWPEKEPVADFSQGVPLATMQKLARYWTTEYDWRKVEAKLNSYPQFITEIDGLDIHFVHVRSKEKNALPVIVTHGWPGSIIEQLKIIDPLTNPTAHGGSASDAFHVVIPSMPGYGFSGKPTTTGWDQARIARAWAVLMKRLGYTRYVAQGGDWGAIINDLMATQGNPEVIGMHTKLPADAGSLGRGQARVRDAGPFIQGHSHPVLHGVAPPNAVRHRGFTHRCGSLAARPRPAQSAAHRTCF